MVDLRSGLRTKTRGRYVPLARHKFLAILFTAAILLGSFAAIAAQLPAVPDRDGDGLPDAAEIRLGIYLKNVADSDGDGITDVLEDANKNGVVDPTETDPANDDTDGDGLSDGAERAGQTIVVNEVSLVISSNDVDGDGLPNNLDNDSDNDRISDRDEYVVSVPDLASSSANLAPGTIYPGYSGLQSNPYDADTDDDGLTDAQELAWGTNPTVANTDGDGWTDGQEVQFGSNPLSTDTDGDGLLDGDATKVDGLMSGVLPVDSDLDGMINALDFDSDNDGIDDRQEGSLVTNAANDDTDGDGWLDGYEYHRSAAGFDPKVAGADTDGDGLLDGVEVAWWKTLPDNEDSDGDGILDALEGPAGMPYTVDVFGHPRPIDSDVDGLINSLDRDSDNDGVKDVDEVTAGTAPYVADTDGDDLSDGAELYVFQTNPLIADTDVDGLSDGAEIKIHKTDPKNDDTDGDGRMDGAGNEGLTVDSDGDGIVNALDLDSDNDGLTDAVEDPNGNGSVNTGETSPIVYDSDADGLPDGYEMRVSRTNPLSTDTDGDGLDDYQELFELTWTVATGHVINIATDPNNVDTDNDGIHDNVEVNDWHSNPISADTDGDGIRDGQVLTIRWINEAGVLDSTTYTEDNTESEQLPDGVSNVLDVNSDWNNTAGGDHDFRDAAEYAYRLTPEAGGDDGLVLGSLHPGMVDTDGDGVSDADEIRANTNPLDARSHQSAPPTWASQDPDADGLYNNEEVILGTDPNLADTDSDGMYDGEELDPLGVDIQHDGTPGQPGDLHSTIAHLFGSNPIVADGDADGQGDLAELTLGTDPNNFDSDGDGLTDGAEVTGAVSDPMKADTDGDLLLDAVRTVTVGLYHTAWVNSGLIKTEATALTLANDTDTDDDNTAPVAGWKSMDDAHEVWLWETNPLSATADKDIDTLHDNDEVFGTVGTTWSDPRWADTDLDGLADNLETVTYPGDRDSDADYLIDGYEVNHAYTGYAALPTNLDPTLADSDADGVYDCAEVAMRLVVGGVVVTDTDGDGFTDGDEAPTNAAVDKELLCYQTFGSYVSDPNSTDSDGDGVLEGVGTGVESNLVDTDGDRINNAMDVDSDNDWVRDGTGTETYAVDLDIDGIYNILDGDSYDNDNLVDPLEYVLFETGSATGDSDYDDDGLLDGNEYFHYFFNPITENISRPFTASEPVYLVRVLANPRRPDTDGDGLWDGFEAGLDSTQTPVPPAADNVGGTLDSPDLDPEGTANSDASAWDTDHDGLADVVEDADQDGVDADADMAAGEPGPTETAPWLTDTDLDGLMDGSENIKVIDGEPGARDGSPVYSNWVDRSNALALDTDSDLLYDAVEAGLQVNEGQATSPRLDHVDHGKYFTNPKSDDTDGDGLHDGVEDANVDGAWTLPAGAGVGGFTLTLSGTAERNPNNCDTDNDQQNDTDDTSPLNYLFGGADWDVVTATATRTIVTVADQTVMQFVGAGTYEISNTQSGTNPKTEDGPGTKAPVTNFYAVSTDLTRTGDVTGYVNPYTVCTTIPGGALAITPDECVSLATGLTTYSVAATVDPATLPGVYKGWIYFMASVDVCQGGADTLNCATTTTAVSTVVPFDSVEVNVVVPPNYDLDILNVDTQFAARWGVGSTDPFICERQDSTNNVLQLVGLYGHTGTVQGVFQITNPNTNPDVVDPIGTNDVNCLPLWPTPKWDIDHMQGNTRLNHVRMAFVQSGGPRTISADSLHFTSNAAGFSVNQIPNMDLAVQDSVVFGVETKNLPAGEYAGVVNVWHDNDNDGVWDVAETRDTFDVVITLVSPDLDISDNSGSLTGNKLAKEVNYNLALEQWTFDASDVTSVDLNQLLDNWDGPGSEAVENPQLYSWNPTTGVGEQLVQCGVSQGVVPSDAATAWFYVYLYNPGNQSYNTSKRFKVKVWSEQSGQIGCDQTQTFKVKVDSLNLRAARSETEKLVDGIYRPYFGTNGDANNGYALMSVRGRSTSLARPSGDGYPVIYNGGGISSSVWGYYDRFEVEIELITPEGLLVIETDPIEITLAANSSGSATSNVTNEGTKVLHNVNPIIPGGVLTLTGGGQTLPATATIDPTTIGMSSSALLTVSTNALGQKAGVYTGTVSITTDEGASDVATINATLLENPRLSAPAEQQGLVCDIANPAGSIKTFVLTNTGNTDLVLTPVVTGFGDVEMIEVSPNPILIPYGESKQVTLHATCASGTAKGQYDGEVSFGELASVTVVLTVAGAPAITLPVVSVTGLPGQVVIVPVPVTNAGNVELPANQTTIHVGDFVPSLPGGKVIPCDKDVVLKVALAIGATATVEVPVAVDPGFFCDTYTAEVSGLVTVDGVSASANNEAHLVLAGCVDRPLAFSHNPVRYAQYQSVDIATTATEPVTIKIYNMTGLLVRTLVDNETLSSGYITWDLKNDDGELLATGMYIVNANIGGKVYREKLLFVK